MDPIQFEILNFLWKWKLATTAGLHQRFFGNLSGRAAYQKLWRMSRKKLVQTESNPFSNHHVWVLGKAGMGILAEFLPEMRDRGHRSEHPSHDLLTSYIHLGTGWTEIDDGLERFSEQQIRRIHPNVFPEWIPKNLVHMPDGYWRLPNSTGDLVALEVELTQKRVSDYQQAARFYEDQEKISKVLWVVPTPGLAETIQRITIAVRDANTKQNFVLLRDVFQLGWDATAFLGPEREKSINSILEKDLRNTGERVLTTFSLDTRKCPYFSIISDDKILSRFSDWIRLSPNPRSQPSKRREV